MPREHEEPGALVEIGNYPTPIDGAMAQARLEGAGIEAVLFDAEMATSWVYTNALGGVRLMVAVEDEETARALLAADASSLAVNDVAAIRDEDQIALDHPETWCPDCHSKDVETVREAPRGLFARLFNPGPALHCLACGHRWRG
jgi:Putative prokaryotic signal transducing protein